MLSTISVITHTVRPRLTATSLLRPLFWPPGKNRPKFSCTKTLVNTAKFFLAHW